MLHKDGSVRWFLSRGSAIRGADGALQRLVGTKVDITERERSADQFRLALEATTTGMLMVSGDGRIVLVNAHVERLFGYRRDELIHAPVDMLLPQWSCPAGEQRELDGLRKDGITIPLEIGFSPLHTPEGEFVLCSIADVTERRGAEREREELTTHLRDMAGRLIAAQEVERARLARDLHDDVSRARSRRSPFPSAASSGTWPKRWAAPMSRPRYSCSRTARRRSRKTSGGSRTTCIQTCSATRAWPRPCAPTAAVSSRPRTRALGDLQRAGKLRHPRPRRRSLLVQDCPGSAAQRGQGMQKRPPRRGPAGVDTEGTELHGFRRWQGIRHPAPQERHGPRAGRASPRGLHLAGGTAASSLREQGHQGPGPGADTRYRARPRCRERRDDSPGWPDPCSFTAIRDAGTCSRHLAISRRSRPLAQQRHRFLRHFPAPSQPLCNGDWPAPCQAYERTWRRKDHR